MKTRKMSLTTQMFIALVFGILGGSLLQIIGPSTFRDDFIIVALNFIGTAFFDMVRMLMPPLVLISVITGVASFSDAKLLGRLGSKMVSIYIVTTAIAVIMGLTLVTLFNPAVGLDTYGLASQQPNINPPESFLSVILGIIPINPFASLAAGNVLQIMFFAMFVGTSIVLIGEKADPARNVFESLNEIILKMVNMVMKIAPIGIFSLLTVTFTDLGWNAIVALGGYLGLVWIGLIIHVIFVYGGIFKFILQKNPNTGKRLSIKVFIKKMSAPIAFSFATSSSAATMPLTIKAADSLGISKKLTSFSIPVGVALNMDGTAIKQAIAVVFLATVYGVPLGIIEYLVILLTATLASIGTAGVPGAGMIMLSAVLSSIGMPVEAIAMIFAVDRIVDMPRTTLNVVGDVVYSLVVAQPEGLLDYNAYDDMTLHQPSKNTTSTTTS